jgi:thiamine biosynthesis lipoprotein
MNRRDFLSRRLASSAGQVLGALDELLPPAAPPEVALLHLKRRAMATTFEVVLPFGTPDAMQIGEDAFDLIDRLEAQLTVYRDNSEVSRLNRLAATMSVPVEAGLFGLLEQSAQLTRDTEGAFDVTAGALIKAWGFFRGPRRVPPPEERQQALVRVGMQHVALDPDNRAVSFQRPGLEINLGSIGKGYALDRVAASLRRRWNLSSVLLHGGHSSVYAGGSQPGDPRGWAVALRHPWKNERLAVVRLRDRALGTSAASFKHLEYQGRKLGHILDPRSGWPAEGVASASVLAPTAAEADALATAFFILGVEKAQQYCAAHPEISAILLPDGEAAPVLIGQTSFRDEASLE